MRALWTPRNPFTCRPSSVRVPVLSKTIMFTLPATFTLWGEMQKIFFCLRRETAKAVPAVMAAGRAGGTVIVMRLRHLSTILAVEKF